MRIAPILLAALAGLCPAAGPAAGPGIEQMAWLAGCWQGQFGEPGTLERWMPPAGGTMLGMSRTIKQGKTVDYEFMQLRTLPDGVLAYMPQPSGQAPTVFRLVRSGESEAVAENPAHDFPQRISYARPDASRLLASIEGVRNGVARKIEFAFARAACDGPLPSGR